MEEVRHNSQRNERHGTAIPGREEDMKETNMFFSFLKVFIKVYNDRG